jgi:uncharacterized protein (TIGR02246 family)
MRVLPSAAATAALLMTGSFLLADEWSYDSQTDQAMAQKSAGADVLALSSAQSEVQLAREVAALEEAQLVAWNKHDLAGYLQWYWNSPELISLSNGDEIVGYTALANEMRTAFGTNPTSMGQTMMDRLRIKMVGNDTAIMVASYVTTTSKHVDAIEDMTVVRHLPEGWRIVFESATIHAQ